MEAIDGFKINISEKTKNDSKNINCLLFKEFININEKIDNLIEKFNQNCKESWKITGHNGFRIYFPYQIMIDLTKEIIVNKIVKYLNRIILDVTSVDSIIFAWSVSSNSYVISMIKQELIGYLINYYLSTHPSVAVVKGAVIFGLNPCIIRKRISKYTIGEKDVM